MQCSVRLSLLPAESLTSCVAYFHLDLNLNTLQDTAGQERFHALGPIYYRESNGAVLLYDITDEDSFQKVNIPKQD